MSKNKPKKHQQAQWLLFLFSRKEEQARGKSERGEKSEKRSLPKCDKNEKMKKQAARFRGGAEHREAQVGGQEHSNVKERPAKRDKGSRPSRGGRSGAAGAQHRKCEVGREGLRLNTGGSAGRGGTTKP